MPKTWPTASDVTRSPPGGCRRMRAAGVFGVEVALVLEQLGPIAVPVERHPDRPRPREDLRVVDASPRR